MPNLLPEGQSHCHSCGVPNTPEINSQLWDIYDRIEDGRSTWEPLVYSREEYEDSWDDQYEENYAMIAMERNMHERGLCPTCGRPDLRGISPDQIMSEEDAKEMHDMWAEQAAERRAGC